MLDFFTVSKPAKVTFTVFGGRQDNEISEVDLRAWSEVTRGGCELRMMDGDHFFIQSQADALVPFPETAGARFRAWLAQQENGGRRFTPEQLRWLEAIRDHVAANLEITTEDLEYAPFAQHGGLGAAYHVFGDDLQRVLPSQVIPLQPCGALAQQEPGVSHLLIVSEPAAHVAPPSAPTG